MLQEVKVGFVHVVETNRGNQICQMPSTVQLLFWMSYTSIDAPLFLGAEN